MRQSAFYRNINTLVLVFLIALSSPPISKAAGQGFLVSDSFIRDLKTRLIWSRDANPAHCQMSWDDAVAYVKMLNEQKYAGRSDWRLPDLEEIKNLTDNARNVGSVATFTGDATVAPALLNVGFRNVEAGGYWTSSSSVFNETEAWYFSMTYGDKLVGSKSLYMYVWPVRWEKRDNLRRPAPALRGRLP